MHVRTWQRMPIEHQNWRHRSLSPRRRMPKKVRFLEGDEEYKYASFLKHFEWCRRGGRAARSVAVGGPEGQGEETMVKWWQVEEKMAVEGWLERVEEGVEERWWEREDEEEKGRRKLSLGGRVIEGSWGVKHELVRARRKWSGGKW